MIDVPEKALEKELIACAFNQRKTLYILIDEAYLLDMQTQFPSDRTKLTLYY